MDQPLWAWAALILAVPVLAAVDMLLFGRGEHDVPMRKAAVWSGCWVALGLAFSGVLFATEGATPGTEYLTGYLVEWSLSVDNLFVFAVIFTYFAVPKALQAQVLLWGILGALVLRGIFIAVGGAALEAAGWVIYIFGGFLILTGLRLARGAEEVDPSKNRLLKLVNRLVPSVHEYHHTKIFIRRNGVRLATPVLAVLMVVASTDVLFAVDSIPAIYGVTRDPFIVLAANVFALMGLRAAYFVIVGALSRFEYLKYGLAAVLVFIGVKMCLSFVWHPPSWFSLPVVVVILGIAALVSLWATRGQDGDEPAKELTPPRPPTAVS